MPAMPARPAMPAEDIRPVYHMSSVGGCPRAVVAQRLGYDVVEPPEFMQTAAKEGIRHEAFVAEDLEQLGWRVSKAVFCAECQRSGIHIEINFPPFKLVGHMDRTASSTFLSHDEHDEREHLVEIKSLGRFRAEKLLKALSSSRFREEFPEYAMQVSCYHYASNLPILYAVKNRDTGRLETLQIPALFNLEEIADHVLELEILARKEILPACKYTQGDFERTFCPVRYLCAGADVEREESERDASMPSDEALTQAADMWKVSKSVIAEHETALKGAVEILARACKASGQRVFNTNGLKVTYVAPGVTVSYPKAKLESVVPREMLEQVKEERPREEYVRVELAT